MNVTGRDLVQGQRLTKTSGRRTGEQGCPQSAARVLEGGGGEGAGRLSESLAVYGIGAGLIELVSRDPHLLEGGEGCEDGAADPGRVLPLRRRKDADLQVLRRKLTDVVEQPLTERLEQGGAAGEDNLAVEGLAYIEVGLVDRVHEALVDPGELLPDQLRSEQHLRRPEPLRPKLDDGVVGQLVLRGRAGLVLCDSLLLLQVVRAVARRLLDRLHHLPLRRRVQIVSRLPQQQHQLVGHVPARNIDACDAVWQSEALEDWNRMSDAVAAIQHNTCRPPRSIQTKNGLYGNK
mmetsp:Transcript_22985/g.39462  ORF Transcript_22985/g.39462 Transcript_22985/m.39462 type:complete len:291 (-) Transcript_22985:507-1379(-)